MSLTEGERLKVRSLCALSADELLLACGVGGLRALSLHTGQLVANDLQRIDRVAFDAHTDTLLLLGESKDAHNSVQLVSLRRNAGEWLVMNGFKFINILSQPINQINQYISSFDMAVCDSRVLVLEGYDKSQGDYNQKLFVFDVNAAHTLNYTVSVQLQAMYYDRLACTRRDGDTLVAFSHESSVSLHRLASLQLEQIATSDELKPHLLLFRGDLLLVADWNPAINKHAIVSFRATGNALTERRVLLDAQHSVYVDAWALAGDRLFLWNDGDLHVYDLE